MPTLSSSFHDGSFVIVIREASESLSAIIYAVCQVNQALATSRTKHLELYVNYRVIQKSSRNNFLFKWIVASMRSVYG